MNGRPGALAALPVLDLPGWMDHATCTRPGTVPDVWFPDDDDTAGVERAKALCAGCPVRLLCLARALSLGELLHGVWGGLDAAERRAECRVRVA